MTNKKRVLLTGAGGAIGVHVIAHLMTKTNWELVALDSFEPSHKGYFDRITRVCKNHPDWLKRIIIFTHDLNAPFTKRQIKKIGKIDYILNLASMSDVQESIEDPVPFIKNNTNLMLNILDYARVVKPKVFLHFSCYDKKTRALTKNGIKSYKELKVGDIVFTLNPKTKKVEEQPIEKVIVQDYSGEMIKFDNTRIDLLTTPNHRIYQSDMEVLEAKDCVGKRIAFPKSEGFVGREDISKDLMYLVGVFLGDGFTAYQKRKIDSKSGLTKKERDKLAKDKKTGRFIRTGIIGENKSVISKSWRIFLDIPENDKARIKTEKTLKNLGIKYTKQKGKSGEHLYFTSEKWVKFFNQFGKGAKNKFIPREFLEQNSELLKELFNGLVDSDGYWKTKTFTTISDKLADSFCELAIKIGYIPNKQKRYSKSIFENRIIKGWSWQINFAENEKIIKPERIIKENYNGKIWCIKVKNKNFLVERNGKFTFSGNTDEVYGPAPKKSKGHKEWDIILPSNPYSASKVCQEAIAIAWWRSYDLPLIITNTMNNFGEMQAPSKFPAMIQKYIENRKTIKVHAAKSGEIGTRYYLHSRNAADAILFILEKVKPILHNKGEIDKPVRLNIVGDKQISNMDLVKTISNLMGKKAKTKLVYFHHDNPGHDLHYGLDGSKLKKLGWKSPMPFEESMKNTIDWQKRNPEWI